VAVPAERSIKLLVASSNAGKLREYQALAGDCAVELAPFPDFNSFPAFQEAAPTFAENAAGKTLHYSRFAELPVIADDSGLVVPALGGAPGVHSARYAGPEATSAQRIEKLLSELRAQNVTDRRARFVCVLAMARAGRVLTVVSDSVEGFLLEAPRGEGGFGYDPIFLYPPMDRTFAEIPREEKNRFSHRGKAFLKLLRWLLGEG
jgi:XTP/dITP diphosphohydrolase